MQKLTVVIPTYNEAENLPRIISALFLLPVPELTVLVVDDNSPDGTGRLAEELGQQHPGRISVLHRMQKEGLGRAYLHGYQVAMEEGADFIAQMDADFSHPPEKIVEMFAAVRDYDIVIGSRYVAGGSLDESWPFWRKALSGFGNLYARTILGIPIKDVTGGFRLYRREMLQKLPLARVKSNGYVFQVEMNYLAHLMGARMLEIPIHFADRQWGESKMSFWIQREAAVRVWQVRSAYRDLR